MVDAAARHACRPGSTSSISGGTGSGKTTLLNILSASSRTTSASSPSRTRPSSSCSSRTSCGSRRGPPNIEGKGEITQRDLVRNALRMRPDRIIVGECRGAEALDMLQAMNTGHDGSITTVHANTPRDALTRLETMIRWPGFELPVQGHAAADQRGARRDRADGAPDRRHAARSRASPRSSAWKATRS